MADNSTFEPIKTLQLSQSPGWWLAALGTADEWQRRRAKSLERLRRGEPEPETKPWTGHCREVSTMELQDILVRFNDELRALTEYVRTRKPALLHLVPVVNFMLGDSTLNPETAATNMRRLEAELADEKPKPEKPRTSKPKKPTVKFGNHPQITIEGEPYPLTFEQAQWLDALIDAGDWMSDGKYNRDNNRTSRPDRLRKQLPKEVQRHIETTKSSGSRWR